MPDASHPAPAEPPWRVGVGWDRHRLAPVAPVGEGRPLVLGGVRLESDLGPVSHSDGDALLHAVTDAILGALGLEDLGALFPDTDPDHEGRDSMEFLDRAVRLMRDAGWTLANLDAVVVLQSPKLGPRRDEIRRRLARALGAPPGRVNVKGKTGEGVDATGERRAVDAHAVTLLMRADRAS